VDNLSVELDIPGIEGQLVALPEREYVFFGPYRYRVLLRYKGQPKEYTPHEIRHLRMTLQGATTLLRRLQGKVAEGTYKQEIGKEVRVTLTNGEARLDLPNYRFYRLSEYLTLNDTLRAIEILDGLADRAAKLSEEFDRLRRN
jgi:hypothetical protein